MRYFMRCLKADFQKTKHLSIGWAHILIPLCVGLVFLGYYSFAPWSAYSKVEAYFQVLGIGFPFLIGIFSVMLSEQEQAAGDFQEMLSAPKRLPVFISKLLLLILLGAFSIVLASVLFGIGYVYILGEQFLSLSFYGKAAFILLGSSVVLYIWHLFLAFRFNKGVSLGIGVVESLVSALFLTGMGDAIWRYVPCAWAGRFVTYAVSAENGQNVFGADGRATVFLCIAITVSALVLYGIWACRWEGQSTGD